MLNKVLAFFSEIIHYAWHKVRYVSKSNHKLFYQFRSFVASECTSLNWSKAFQQVWLHGDGMTQFSFLYILFATFFLFIIICLQNLIAILLVTSDKAQLGLSHSYSRAKVKFNVNKSDNMIIQERKKLYQVFICL